jgi:sugar phosphate isomerase/epimerase
MVTTSKKLGLSGHHFIGLEPEELLKLMTEQYQIHYLDYWPINNGDLSLSVFQKLLEKYKVSLYTVNVLSSEGRLLSPNEEESAKKAIIKGIEQASQLGAKYVQFYTGTPEFGSHISVVDHFLVEMSPLIKEAEKRGVVLVMENNLDQRGEDANELNPSRRPDVLKDIFEKANSPFFKMAYDPCNFYTTANESFPYAYDLLKPHIINVHLKDCKRYSPVLHGNSAYAAKLLKDTLGGPFLPTPVGQGAINWKGIIDRIESEETNIEWYTVDPFVFNEKLNTWCEESLDYIRSILFFEKETSRAF